MNIQYDESEIIERASNTFSRLDKIEGNSIKIVLTHEVLNTNQNVLNHRIMHFNVCFERGDNRSDWYIAWIESRHFFKNESSRT